MPIGGLGICPLQLKGFVVGSSPWLLRENLLYPRGASNSLCIWEWPWSFDPPAGPSWVLELQTWTTTPIYMVVGIKTQAFMCACCAGPRSAEVHSQPSHKLNWCYLEMPSLCTGQALMCRRRELQLHFSCWGKTPCQGVTQGRRFTSAHNSRSQSITVWKSRQERHTLGLSWISSVTRNSAPPASLTVRPSQSR